MGACMCADWRMQLRIVALWILRERETNELQVLIELTLMWHALLER